MKTLADLMFRIRELAAGRPVLLSSWQPTRREQLSAADFVRHVHSLALALEEEGVERGMRVAILSDNRPEWPVVDFACQLLGATVVPVHAGWGDEQVGYILRNSGAAWVFVGGDAQKERLARLWPSFPAPPRAVPFDGSPLPAGGSTLTQLLAGGAERRGEVPIERFRGRVSEDDLAALFYTSGTEGVPRGVMLSHRNLVSNVIESVQRFDLGPGDTAVSILPLAHIFGRSIDYACSYCGIPVCYVADPGRLPDALRVERPSLLAAGPVHWAALLAGVRRELAEAGPGGAAFRWAVSVGQRAVEARSTGSMHWWLAAQRAVAELPLRALRRRRFGGQLRLGLTGGAALPSPVEDLYAALGQPLYPGYGLTEASPVVSVSSPGDRRPGSVGRPLSGVEVRVAEDDEILVRGDGVMRGYWDDADGTREAIDDEGWLHTGDLGHLDPAGFLYLTGRKKELLVAADGQNVAPQQVEVLLTAQPVILQAVAVGDHLPYVAALLVPDQEALRHRLGEPAVDAVTDQPEARRLVAEAITAANAGLPTAAQVKAWTLLDHPLTVEAGELTATGKLRRQEIERRYATTIASLYGEGTE